MDKKKILVIDDDKDIQKLLNRYFGNAGYEVLIAANGKEGLAVLEKNRPDLVILDFNMPEMNGVAVLKEIHDNPTLQKTAVIMLTAANEKLDILQILRIGVEGYLMKPLASPTILLERVREVLDGKVREVAVLTVDNDQDILKLLVRKLPKIGYRVLTAKSGREGIDKLAREHVDVVLLDQMMPEMDGIETFKKISQKFVSPPPVIMATAHGSTHLAAFFMKAGGAGFVEKPLDLAILDVTINQVLQTSRWRRQMREIETSMLAARESSLIKDLVFDLIGHEIRTPLTLMMPAIEDLKIELAAVTGGDVLAKLLEPIDKGSCILERLAENITDVLPILTGEILPVSGPVDLTWLAAGLKEKAEPDVTAKKLELVIDFPEKLPPVLADEELLGKILNQLIGNAVKFTEKGSVNITARQKNDRVIISVKDTGIGIPGDKMAILFNRFAKVDQSGYRPGAGLGLYICRCLVELMEGTIQVESEVGKGSTFLVSLGAGQKQIISPKMRRILARL